MINDTLQPVDGYTRLMLGAFIEPILISTGFQSIFARGVGGGRTTFAPDSLVLDIDIMRANEPVAKLSPRGVYGRAVGGKANTKGVQSTSIARKFPFIEIESNISADQLLSRMPGDTSFQIKTQREKLQKHALNFHTDQQGRITRAFEISASEALLDGQMLAVSGTSDADLIYDFYRNSDNIFTVSNSWDGGSPTIMDDLDDGVRIMRVNGKLTPDFLVVGREAIAAYIKDSTILTLADARRVEMVRVSTNNPVPQSLKFLETAGMIAVGQITTPMGVTMWMFTYQDVYTNDAGTAVDYMPPTKVLMGSSKARCDRAFGPNERMPKSDQERQWEQEMFGTGLMPLGNLNISQSAGVITGAMFHVDAYPGATKKNVTIRTQASYIPIPTQTDAWITMTVIF